MGKVKAGVARVCITPPLGTPLSGYFEPRYASGVHDELYATAVAFADGENRAVILSLDLCGLKNQWWLEDCKKMIGEFCNIPLESIIINCSHTHTGPVVGFDRISGVDSNKIYDDFLMQSLRDAAYYAFDDLCDAKFYVAENICPDVGFCRIFKMKDGSVRTNPGVSNPDILHAVSKPNEKVTLVKITREDAEDIFIVNFGVHADTIGGDVISADFPGVLKQTIENVFPDTVCLFLQGCEGDINHVDVRWDWKRKGFYQAQDMGRRLAGAVLQVCDKAEEIAVDDISFANKTIQVPTNQENHRLESARKIVELHRAERDDEIEDDGAGITTIVAEALRIIELENGPEQFEFNISAIRIGSIAIAGLPGEPFAEIGKRIIAESPVDTTIVCALTDGGEIYFPTTEVIGAGGYEARSSVVKPGADDILVNSMLELLKEIK